MRWERSRQVDAVPLDLLRSEQTRLGRERADAEERLEASTRAVRELEAHVEAALALPTNAQDHYRVMDDQGRQLLNQALFEAIWIGDDDVEAAEVRPGLAELVSDDLERYNCGRTSVQRRLSGQPTAR